MLVLCLVMPATAWAGEDEEESYATFGVQASNGYRILVYAYSESGGVGKVVLYVVRNGTERVALYQGDAFVTDTSVDAYLGPLGRINLDLYKTGKFKVRRNACFGTIPLERARYYGTFEFHGEEGFTDATAHKISASPLPFLSLLLCGSRSIDIERSDPGETPAGALLQVVPASGRRSALFLQVAKNRPEGKALIRATVWERRYGLLIARGVGFFAGSRTFEHDSHLRTATVRPPAPFSGSAVFRRGDGARNGWRGNLTVDLPGRAGVHLARRDLEAALARGSWEVNRSDGSDRPVLARPLALLE